MAEPLLPSYKDVDGFRIAISFSPDALRSGLSYRPRQNDLFIASYPKTGTTWTQMLALLIQHRGQPPLTVWDFYRMSPFLEMHGRDALENASGIVAIKTHLPVDILKPTSRKAKYIYVTRNPKDTCTSFFNHTASSAYLFEDGNFDVFFDLFMEGKTDFGDYFDHVLGWYKLRKTSNVLFLTYEDLKKDTRKVILQIAKFMGEDVAKDLETDEKMMDKILKYSSVEHMKTILNSEVKEIHGNLSISSKDIDNMDMPSGMKYSRKFIIDHRTASSKHRQVIRKGVVGDWREVLTPDQVKRMDEKIEKKFGGTELLEFWKRENCV